MIHGADSEKRKKEFDANPELYMRYRKEIEAELNVRFKFVSCAFHDFPIAIKACAESTCPRR